MGICTCQRELVVIALDKELVEKLPRQIEPVTFEALARVLPSNFSIWDGKKFNFDDLWRFRLQFLARMLSHNVGVLMNDLDAIWIKGPRSLDSDASVV